MREHDFEPVEGLPERPPEAETVLWQGAPSWKALLRHAFHLRWIAGYFGALAVWRGVMLWQDGQGLVGALEGASLLVGLGLVVLGLFAAFAWGTGRTTVYTITTRRLVVRTGIALPMAVNLPFSSIAAADVVTHPDGSGEVRMRLVPRQKVSWLAIWPHARPWRFARVEPTLRGLEKPTEVARVLARALAAETQQAVAPLPEGMPVYQGTSVAGAKEGRAEPMAA